MEKVLGVCSGGIDSSTWIAQYEEHDITVMFFDYGQKALRRELIAAEMLADKLDANYITVDMSFMKDLYGSSNQLTSDDVEIKEDYEPTVVVPLRNGVFLTVAAAYAYAHDFDKILMGSHMSDIQLTDMGDRLYPDCSPEYFKTAEVSFELGTKATQKKVSVHTPSMHGITKPELVQMGKDVLGDFIYQTWSCYRGGEVHCGTCESCINRREAFKEAGIKDKTGYENDYSK